MAFAWKLFVCLVLATAVCGQVITVEMPSSTTYPQATNSDYFFVQLSEDLQDGNTVQLDLSDLNGGNVNIQPSTLIFSGHTRALSFRVSSGDNSNTTYTIHFEKSQDAAGQFAAAPADFTVSFAPREIYIESFPTRTFIGEYSQPIKIWIKEPSNEDLTLTATLSDDSNDYLTNVTIEITPNPVTIPAGSLSASFVYRVPSSVIVGAQTVEWSVSGGQGFYVQGSTLDSVVDFGTTRRQITLPTMGVSSLSTEVVIGPHGNSYLYVYTRQAPNGTFTLTPQAADTTFNPSSLQFDVNTQLLKFMFTTTSWEITKTVYWFLDQDNTQAYYAEPAPTTIVVPKRQVYVTMPNPAMILTNRTQMTISLDYPTINSLTVSFFAAQMTFSVPSVTFTAGKNTTSFSVAIDPKNIGADTISFLVSGADSDWYDDIADIPVTINNAQFTSPNNWYAPTLYIGATSPKILVRAAVSPIKGVTLTPSGPNLMFTPSTLTFRNGTEQQYFTITPLYTNSNANQQANIPVTFLVSGTDHAYFNAPAPMTVTVNRRFIQNDWSAHLSNTNTARNPTNTLHLGKTYKIWSSINYIGSKDTVTMTPVSPYFSFNPKVVTFNSKNTRVMLEATVTGVTDGGDGRIDYIIGGNDGGWYAPIQPDMWKTAIRPLKIEAAVLATDNRIPKKKAALIDYPDLSLGQLASQWTVYSFKLRSFVLADKGLKITPNCPHATFSPSSITLNGGDAATIYEISDNDIPAPSNVPNGGNFHWLFNNTDLYLEANFTVHPQASGTHLVTFDLSGSDADFYKRPDDVMMRFSLVNRDDDEPKQAASAGVALPSIVLFVFALFCATFM